MDQPNVAGCSKTPPWDGERVDETRFVLSILSSKRWTHSQSSDDEGSAVNDGKGFGDSATMLKSLVRDTDLDSGFCCKKVQRKDENFFETANDSPVARAHMNVVKTFRNLPSIPSKYYDKNISLSSNDKKSMDEKVSSVNVEFTNVLSLYRESSHQNGVALPHLRRSGSDSGRRGVQGGWKRKDGGFLKVTKPTNKNGSAFGQMNGDLSPPSKSGVASPNCGGCHSETGSVNDDTPASCRSPSFYAAMVQQFRADDDFLVKGVDRRLKYIDTHCHLDLLLSRGKRKIKDFDEFLFCCKHTSPHFAGCIADFCFPEFLTGDKFSMWKCMANSSKVWLAIGVHPHSAHLFDELLPAIEDKLVNDSQKIVAVGEMGLDYSKNNSVDHLVQQETLKKQLKLAIKYNKPILLHCRDAAEDCWQIFKEIVPFDYKIHWHCYTDSFEMYTQWSNYFQNAYFGVTLGVYSPRGKQEHFWKFSSIDRLVIETDSPYFLPQRFKSRALGSLQHCHPGLGALVAFKLALYRDLKVEDVLAQIWTNTLNLYDLKLS